MVILRIKSIDSDFCPANYTLQQVKEKIPNLHTRHYCLSVKVVLDILMCDEFKDGGNGYI